MPTAIEFNNISKLYRLGLVSSGTLSHDLQRWWQMNVLGKEDPFLKVGSVNDRSKAADSEYVWALKDIDFKVEQGDVVGIIGKNGAGKSTLLKLLSKVTAPTTGTIKARGRIASLLEVGTGFHGELTGRENIYMNGAILGMTKAEITRKLDEIVGFSGCERYIDTPVKRYSSGMMVRLGFAVAAHLDPEILVVDEVLAVGDAEFQKKAIGKMQDVSQEEGRTVLFVSHNMASIKQLCRSGVLLDKGQVTYMGSAADTVGEYLRATDFDVQGSVAMRIHFQSKSITIDEVLVNGSKNTMLHFVGNDKKTVSFSIKGTLLVDMNISVEVFLYDRNESLIAGYSPTDWDGSTHRLLMGKFEIQESFDLPETLTSGEYSIAVLLSQKNIEHLVRIEHLASISVEEFASPITGNVFWQSYIGSIVLHHDEK
jgi:lipopolysaccharide transport system ATP-binding protein